MPIGCGHLHELQAGVGADGGLGQGEACPQPREEACFKGVHARIVPPWNTETGVSDDRMWDHVIGWIR